MDNTFWIVTMTIFIGTFHSVVCNNNREPQFIIDPNAPPFVKPENTSVGTVLLTLTATDPDGPQPLHFSIPANHPSALFVKLQNERGDSTTGRLVDVILIAPLDSDYTEQPKLDLRFAVQDDVDGLGNYIIQEITMFIYNVNDEDPKFRQSRYEHDIPEDTPKGSTVTNVTADDPDSGRDGKVKYSMVPVGQAISEDYQYAFVINATSGQITLNTTLDASKYNYYEYMLVATDGGGRTGESVLLIKIIDIQDKPPYFTNLPYTASVMENATMSTKIIQVTALDGDKGVPNTVSYSFIQGDEGYFDIEANTGWITVKTTLDRDTSDVKQKGGTFAIYVKARENDNSQPEDHITATTMVTIKIEDINDNEPRFNSPTYTATILENMQEGVPITFTGPGAISYMNVSDADQGVNSHFALLLEQNGQPYRDFAPLPDDVFVESSVLIRVQNRSALNYETSPTITFQIVAREIETAERRSSTADVTIYITDMNDNYPVFHPATLEPLMITENATIGTQLIILNATDLDKDKNGEITYHIRGANSVFQINETTGEIILQRELDRESVDEYFLTAETRDGGGLTTFINLEVQVTDVNDHKPMFRRDEYYVTVQEDSQMFLRGDLIVEATDDDEPGTVNSEIMYRIIIASAGLANKFSVNQTSGEITMVDKIDYESLPLDLGGKVLLEVEAYDLGQPELSNRINITVEIEDVNDNTPVFNQTEYTATVYENAVGGTSVVQVFATDGDSTRPSNTVLYRIDSGASDKFRINFNTGEISVELGAKLDRETKSMYKLNISATDRGATPRTGLCIVTIELLDTNDEPPVFEPQVAEKSINEATQPGEVVVCLNATDPDNDPILSYSLVSGTDANGDNINVTELFEMDSISGCIKIYEKLDRETSETYTLITTVHDLNAVSDGKLQTATGTVLVTLLDSNDNKPMFLPSNVYEITISEGLQLDSPVMTFSTQDLDKDQTVTYKLQTDAYDYFIVSSSGVLRLKSALDRETVPSFVVTVLAIDDGSPKMTGTATLSVSVQDINDNNPVFESYETEYTVNEDAIVGKSIARIEATDADLEEFGHVVYTFDVSNNDGKLAINGTTGEIYVSQTLDRESRSSYTLYVKAIDNPYSDTNQRTNQTRTIIIRVTDVNDNDPEFTNIDPNNWPTALENENPSKLIHTITADDADEGRNSQLEYKLKGSSEVLALFDIVTVSRLIGGVPKYFGEIHVASSLNGYTGEQQFNVTVTDKGVIPRTAEKRFAIIVEDVNTYKPVFVKPSKTNASISTLEKSMLNELIYTISATDQDSGRNAEIVYTLEKENDWQSFLLDPVTGQLRNKAVLDRETHPVYILKIKAEDKGSPPFVTPLTLTIVILDENDNPPEFQDDRSGPYRIQVEEERVAAQSSISLNIAVDKDAGNNSIICYYIIGGDPIVSSHFSLDPQGNLTMTQALDRETLEEPYINMTILATPQCFVNIPMDTRPAFYPPTGYNTNRTILWVQVEIIDINDNPPEFKQSLLTLGVTRDTGFGTSITNLQDLITDPDETMKVEFSALRTEQFLTEKLTTNEPFKVFKNGTVATNMYFKPNMYGYFLIHIQAKENVTGGEPFLANATLRISLINDDQRLKVVFRKTPDQVRGFQVVFTQKLQNTTGYRIVVDKIQTHESPDSANQVNLNMTDMYIHGEDLKTNETVPPEELLRVIDSHAVELLGLRYSYNVVEIVPTKTQTEEQSLEEVYKLALILVTVILTLIIIAILIVFYISRQQYKRKLKAATALAYGSNSDLHKLELPGTNVHAYENANPIYLEKVLLEEAGEQDDDDSIDNNAVGTTSPSAYDEQQAHMNFYTEDNNLNKVPQSKLGTGDAVLSAALLHHQQSKLKNSSDMQGTSNGQLNGHSHSSEHFNRVANSSEYKQDNFAGLPTTEI